MMLCGDKLSVIVGIIMAFLLVMSMARNIQEVFSQTKVEVNNILRDTERNHRMTQATGYEALNIVYFKMSIRPNPAMLNQGKRLKDLVFEVHDSQEILRR